MTRWKYADAFEAKAAAAAQRRVWRWKQREVQKEQRTMTEQRHSAFREAAKEQPTDEPRCPKCRGFNLPAPAKPSIEIDAHGRATCDECGHVWVLPDKQRLIP